MLEVVTKSDYRQEGVSVGWIRPETTTKPRKLPLGGCRAGGGVEHCPPGHYQFVER